MRSGQVQIDDGYAASRAIISITAMCNDNPSGDSGSPPGINANNVFITVSAAGQTIRIPWPNGNRVNDLVGKLDFSSAPVGGTVTYMVYGHNINQMDVNVAFVATPQQSAVDQWRLQTYEKIVSAYKDLEQTYEAEVTAAKMTTQTVGPLGAANPDANALTTRTELKRSCIAIFDSNPATVDGRSAPVILDPVVPPATAPNPANPQLPMANVATAQTYGRRVRWFEEAFEWENMAYVLYPYYWGRRTQWVANMAITNTDPEFLQFLQAGSARVVVPVRLGFERAVCFYLHTGLPWFGKDLPPVSDDTHNPLYLDVAEEIKALTGGGEPNEIEVPVGDPWEYVLPTTLMKLRDGDDLPEWHRNGPVGDSGPQFASDAPDDAWTWKDGAPSI